jgi:MYXO-CTERM domain-containing protein
VCRANQNSVALLRERLGVADAIQPTIATLSPANNATVPPGFQIKLSGNDNNAVTGAVLKIDGTVRDEKTGAGPFTFTTPANLTEGNHTYTVEVSDGKNIKSEQRTVIVMLGAPPPDDDDGLSEYGAVSGGCSTGGTRSGGLLLALGALLATRRRRAKRAA